MPHEQASMDSDIIVFIIEIFSSANKTSIIDKQTYYVLYI